jgi:hypothetical protein
MKKLIVVLALLALVPAVSPPAAHALTLAQRVQRLEGKLNCLRRVPMNEYADYAGYGDPVNGLNATETYATSANTTLDPEAVDNPDALTDADAVPGLDWAFTDLPPDYFVLAIRADDMNVPYPGCAQKFGLQPTPVWWRAATRMTHLRQLSRVE